MNEKRKRRLEKFDEALFNNEGIRNSQLDCYVEVKCVHMDKRVAVFTNVFVCLCVFVYEYVEEEKRLGRVDIVVNA